MKQRILTASPVRRKPVILRCFLDYIEKMRTDGLHVDYLFYDDNDEEASRELLRDFGQRHANTTIFRSEHPDLPYQIDESTHYWNDGLVFKVAAMKDEIIEHALEREYDALFLVDSDVLLHPQTLVSLIQADRPVVAEIFWTKWRSEGAELPQVWMTDEYTFYRSDKPGPLNALEARELERRFLEQLRQPGVYEVGGLGACTLIGREVLERGARFRRLPNLSFWGEDRHFCIRCAALGYPLHVDTHYPALHVYRDSDLAQVEAFRSRIDAEAEGIAISLCMIVKDEEEVLERCLRSVREVADEIVIVDTGSTDRTREIAARYTDRIFDFAWDDDFAAARNYAFSQARMPYILWMDADDVFEEEDRRKLIALKSELTPDVDSVMMGYVLSRDASGNPAMTIRRNRLVKRSRGFRWIGAVHEYLEVRGHIRQSDILVTHKKERVYGDRNLRIYERRLERGEAFTPRDLYYFANELRDHARHEEAIKYYELFLETKRGWVEDNIAACLKMSDCYGHLSDRDRKLQALLRSFEYDRPRTEGCCRIGALFLEENKHELAAFWFELAIQAGEPPQEGSVVDHAAWTWLPYLQLCVCYDRLGQHERAYECNERALAYHPTHPSMLYNRNYFREQWSLGGEDPG